MKLKKVVASILTDLTRAQAASDAYSREIKAAYKEDSLLRLLPVPKAEIKEIKLDLKFAFLKADRVVLYEQPNYQGRSQELLEGNYTPEILKVRTNENEMSLKVSDGMKVTISGESFVDSADDGIKTSAIIFTEDTPKIVFSVDIFKSIKVEHISTNELTDDLETLDVEILTDELKQLPESVLSSISITLNLDSI
ncbi:MULTISPECIES: hypothetical protein [Cyanophyceae]|uniref:Beta/gamma crystallin 'Greek key' domain-containing protein n=2 Tax=Cyanophyceae TaxID=3028117 RepID=A0A4Q7E5B0_9CYAN|nr:MULTISPECIES: hypothetical protein [Cyanophyceae]MCM1982969.1 beta/gamma crystallin family protein [Lyngbya confervoides BDU141951]RZM77264.1 hypothetical protein DYY88_16605 [Leptolyngbya sp. LK]